MFKKNEKVVKVENNEQSNKDNWVCEVSQEGRGICRCAHEADADIIVLRLPNLTLVMCEKCAINLAARTEIGVFE